MRAPLGLAALALAMGPAAAAPRARPTIDRYGGGTLTSPDGRWRITAPADDPDNKGAARASLQGPSVSRHLLDFDRLIQATWSADRRHVLLNLIDIDYQALDIRTLGPRETGHPHRIARAIDRQMRHIHALLHDVGRQSLAFGRINRAECVAIEQDGPPKGRSTGSYVTRRDAFLLDLARERTIRVPRCPGARFD